MIPRIELQPVETLDSEFIRGHRKDFRFIAGGTDLVVQLRSHKTTSDFLVDISRIRELHGIRQTKRNVSIGSQTTLEELRTSPLIGRKYPAIKEAADVFAAWQVRNLATIGGNICNASPAADLAPPLLIYKAKIRTISRKGTREIPIEDFFQGPGKTCLQKAELVTHVVLPSDEVGGSAFLKLGKRQASILAVVNAAAYLKGDGVISEARLALGAVAPTPIRARRTEEFLRGKRGTDSTFAEAAALARSEVKPISDVRAGASYREEMVEVFTKKVLGLAWVRVMRGKKSR